MIRGLYSAAGGMQATSLQQDVTAHNLNHAMKPGYQREVLQFKATGPHEELLGPDSVLHTDFSRGTLEHTGNTLDVALNGPGFFQIQGPSGSLYTRSGTFHLNGQGQIVTPEGRIVRGTGGPIAIPAEAVNIEILDDGTVVADGDEIDQLSIVAFVNPSDMTRVGTTYFEAAPNAARSEIGPEVRQGYRENSNTTIVHEMVQMIAGLRQFEAAQRALRSLGDAIALNTRPLNR